MSHLLIAEMSNKSCRGQAHSLVIALERLPELDDEPREKQLTDLRQLRIDDCGHRRVYRCKWQTGRLSFHDTPTEQAPAAHQVLPKQLWDDEFDIRHVDLVDETVDRFLERLPCHALILLARFIGDL
jgi:hypothetical protein